MTGGVPRTTEIRIPREVTRQVKAIAAGLLRAECDSMSGFTWDLADKYGDDVVSDALIRLADRIEAL